MFLIILLTSIFAITSSKIPDLTLKISANQTSSKTDHRVTEVNENFTKQFNSLLSVTKFNSDHSQYGECPTWMYRANESEKCICGVDNYHTVKCDQSIEKVYILDSYRMTYDEENQETVVGASLYGVGFFNDSTDYDIYHQVPMNRLQLNEFMCGQFNRKGRLCGECKQGYSPLAYSYNVHCMKCSSEESRHNIFRSLSVMLIPPTAFYVTVVLFKFNANSPIIHGFVLYAQSVSAPFVIRLLLLDSYSTIGIQFFATVYGIWNLDFFRTLYPGMCLQLTTLQVIALDYVIAFYPLLLMLLTTVAFKLYSRHFKIVRFFWYPFSKCLKNKWNRASMIDMFATFLLLSYGRIMSVSINLLVFTSVVNSKGVFKGRYLYYDSSYKFLGTDHLPYGILAVFILTISNLFPLVLLTLYPISCFQKCLNCFGLSHIALHTFVDSFAGCYKDGTEPGTRDCRYFAGLYLFIRLIGYIVYEATVTDFFYGICGMIAIGILLLYVIFQPYKPKYAIYNKVMIAMIAMMIITLFSVASITIADNKMYQAVTFSIALFGLTIFLPQIYLIIVVIKMTGVYSKIKGCISKVFNLDQDSDDHAVLIAASRELQ